MNDLPLDFRIPGLSVAVIARNEQDNIGECLDSVAWADEVVVVDDFSTDRTPEICRSRGVRFFQEPWKGFAGQRNSAVDKTRNPWVLALDADERVTPQLAREMRRRLEDAGEAAGFRIPYRNHFRGQWIRGGGWYPDYHLRLFRKDRGRFSDREIHEAPELDGPVETLDSPLIHLAYRDIAHYLRKMDSYSTLMARQYHREGRTGGPWTGLSHALFFPFTRGYIGSEFGAIRHARDW